MFSGLASVLIVGPLDLVTLAVVAINRAATVGFLRLATLLIAQAFDLATFGIMVTRHGPGAEANPIVSDLFVAYGMPAVVFAKIALVVLVAALWVSASAQREDRGRTWAVVGGLPLALAIAAGIIGGITNAATFLA